MLKSLNYATSTVMGPKAVNNMVTMTYQAKQHKRCSARLKVGINILMLLALFSIHPPITQ